MKKLGWLILKIADYCWMNVMSLCLNVDIKVNLNYSDWGGGTEVPTLDNSRDIDAGWFLLEIIIFISVVNNIIWRRFM